MREIEERVLGKTRYKRALRRYSNIGDLHFQPKLFQIKSININAFQRYFHDMYDFIPMILLMGISVLCELI